MNNVIDKCPICKHDLMITKVFCDHCGTTITGQFGMNTSPFNRLNQDQIAFLLTFIRCEGKLKRMEEEMNLSYPTIKNRFNEILATMGYDLNNHAVKSPGKAEQIEILRKLDMGEISPKEADAQLHGKAL